MSDLDLPVTTAELRATFARFVDEVAARESALADGWDHGSPQGLRDCLERVDADWHTGTRTLRTLPVVNVLERRFGVGVDEDVRAVLLGLDATVNALDDVIDAGSLDTGRAVCLTAVVAFANVLELEHVPAEHAAAVADVEYDYWVELAQIPLVERRSMAAIRAADDRAALLDAARTVYGYRARDVHAFVDVPAVVYDLPAAVVARLRRDLHAFRARYLLFEDLRHVDRDRVEGHANPAVALAGRVDDGVAVDLFESVYDAFGYSDAGTREYGDLLGRLERRPDDLASAVATLG
ncbi:hypothetical protein ACFQH6_01175 [Halobacteriaceae archaeon GCM10025711]